VFHGRSSPKLHEVKITRLLGNIVDIEKHNMLVAARRKITKVLPPTTRNQTQRKTLKWTQASTAFLETKGTPIYNMEL
jgi:hypothetical protein